MTSYEGGAARCEAYATEALGKYGSDWSTCEPKKRGGSKALRSLLGMRYDTGTVASMVSILGSSDPVVEERAARYMAGLLPPQEQFRQQDAQVFVVVEVSVVRGRSVDVTVSMSDRRDSSSY